MGISLYSLQGVSEPFRCSPALCSRWQLLKDAQEGGAQEKEAEPGQVRVARPSKAGQSQRTTEGKELRRQISMGYDAPPPPQVGGQGGGSAVGEGAGGWESGQADGPPCPASPGTLQRYLKHTAMKEKAAKWRERRSEGERLENCPEILNLTDRRTQALKYTCLPRLTFLTSHLSYLSYLFHLSHYHTFHLSYLSQLSHYHLSHTSYLSDILPFLTVSHVVHASRHLFQQ